MSTVKSNRNVVSLILSWCKANSLKYSDYQVMETNGWITTAKSSGYFNMVILEAEKIEKYISEFGRKRVGVC